jgi:hypothetical protein
MTNAHVLGSMSRVARLAFTVTLGVVLYGATVPMVHAVPQDPPSRDVDDRADELLRAMSAAVAGAERLQVNVAISEEVVDTDTGNVVHLLSKRTIALARPDRLHIAERGTFTNTSLWFLAGKLVILDAADNTVASTDAPETIDGMLDHLFTAYGLLAPGTDLLRSDPYAGVAPRIERGRHLGPAMVDGHRCHHLAFRQETIDWQVWVDAGERPLPRKLVITYKDEPGHPQYHARYRDWDLAPTFRGGTFDPRLPDGVEEIDFRAMTGALEEEEVGFVRPETGMLASLMLAPFEAWAPEPQRRGGGRARAGGARGGGRSYSRGRGTVRSSNRGSVRYRSPSRSRSRSGSARPSRTPNRGGSVNRTPSRRPSGANRGQPRSAIQRTPSHGSIRDRSNPSRSLADRRHARPGNGEPILDDAQRRHLRRHVRRRHMWDDARRYRWRNNYYYWGGGYWWSPYYYGDDVEYVVVDPPAGMEVELPEEAVAIDTDDGTLYELNGVYYRKNPDGTFVVAERPDDGMPDPVTIVRQACDFIKAQSSFTMSSTDTMDHVQDDGQKIQRETSRSFRLQRPDRLAADAKGDDVDRLFWYDGEEITILDRKENIYAAIAAPDTIDAAIDFTVEQLDVSLPLTDWLYSDPYVFVGGALEGATYVGLQDVDGVTCHHLSFSSPDADWQLWVDSGDQPVPRMIAITYTGVDESPTYTARISAWEFDPALPGGTFDARIPEGVEKIPFVTPESEVNRLEDELERLRKENQRVEDYIAANRTIALFSQIADKPDAAAKVAEEQERLKKIGPVSQEEVDAYTERKKELQGQLNRARRDARRSS